jgi:hypothetical protein
MAGSPASLPLESAATVPSVPLDRAIWITSVAISGVLFGFLANRHWVPGGDSEVYVATARNLLLRHFSLTRGFVFNGQPMNMVPPGWPYVLAAAMTFSSRFAFLKLLALLSMLGSLVFAYPVCRRFAPPSVAGAVVVMTAILSHVFPLTFWLHSDALFCLLGTASFLVALQIGEGRTEAWRIALLCILCSAAVTVRWAGLLNWIVVAGAVMNGRGEPIGFHSFGLSYWSNIFGRFGQWLKRPRVSRAAIAMVLSGAATFSTFIAWRFELRVTAQQAAMIKEAGGAEESGLDSRADASTHTEYGLMNATDSGWRGYVARGFSWGDWFSFLFWQPFRFHAIKLVNAVSVAVGWLVAIPLLYLVVRGLAQRQWIWPAVALYAFLLAMSWPHPNARYLVPIAFLLLVSIWAGTSAIVLAHPAARSLTRIAIVLFVVTYVLCNGTLYGVEVWAQRSSDFYGTYEAGLNEDLISADHWLSNHHVPTNESIACSERYVNLSTSARTSKLGLRVTTMLTGRPIITIPKRYMKGMPISTTGPTASSTVVYAAATQPDYIFDPDPVDNPTFLAWARTNSIRYYLYQPPVSPWRALHFRVAWLEERATHVPVVDTGAGWRLYKIPPTGPSAIRILPLPPVGDWPVFVPGIGG